MEKQRVKFGDTVLPIGLQVGILARFMKEKDMKSLYDSYNEVKILDRRTAAPPTALQVKIAKEKKNSDKPSREIAKDFGLSVSQVKNAISRVAIWEYMNGK